MYKIIINICLEISKRHVLPNKSPRKHQIPRDRRALMKKRLKLHKKIQISTNHQTKENVLNQIKEIEINLKISINTERKLEKRELLLLSKITPNTSTNSYKTAHRSELELDLCRMKRGTWNQATTK